MKGWQKAWANHPRATEMFNAPAPTEKPKKDKNKFGVDITPEGKQARTSGGRLFDSLAEKTRYHTLLWRVKAGEITDLELQKKYELVVGDVIITSYVADFVYIEKGVTVVEDCKGFATPEYKIKKNLMLGIYGIAIKET